MMIYQNMRGRIYTMSLPPRYKPFTRLLSFILSFALIFNLLGLSAVHAAPGTAGRSPEKKSSLVADIGELPNKAPKTKMELSNKRTKYSTRYVNPDGSFTEEIYLEPQFYLDSDKKWKKIDNNLKQSKSKVNHTENTANDFKTYFANQMGTEPTVQMEKNRKSISFAPVQSNKVTGTVKGNEITYPEIYPNVTLRYQMKGEGVKEDIILQQPTDKNTFSFELKLKDLKATTEKDGTIVISDDKGKKQWYFEKPYMTDAEGKFSNQVKLKLRTENSKTYIDVIADQAFLQDPTTKYPVTIDPTINQWDLVSDTFVASKFPDSSYSSLNKVYAGNDDPYYGVMRTFTKFYLPSLPSAARITSADVNFYQTNNDTTNATIDVYRVTSNWGGSVTWNTQPSVATTAESTLTNNAINAYWQWDITNLAKDWYNGVQANYGFMLKHKDEMTSFRTFNSINIGSNTPRLSIHYWVDPIGIENFWGSTEDGVNPANGNLVIQNNDLSIPGRGVPVSLTRTYNSRLSEVSRLFGYGWVSNIETQLVDAGTGPITLIDGDGTRHIFGQTAGGGYVAHGGVYLTLVKNTDGTYTVIQTDGTKIQFNTNGKIASIVDTNGNTTTYYYNTSNNISMIQDASGRKTMFSYHVNGKISSVTDPANRTIRYDYDAAGNLVKVTDASGNVTNFSYDSTHNLTSITDARNITTSIQYNSNDAVSSISRPITINGVKETSTTTYTYDFNNAVTTVVDGEGKRVDYLYNPNKNIVQINENPLDANNTAVTTLNYDNNNNLTQVKDPNANKANSSDTYIYTYDANGNITGVQLPEKQNATFSYDGNNNLTKEQDFNKNTSSNDYDHQNNQTESTDANVQTSAMRYNTVGNLLYSTHPMSVGDNLIANSSFERDGNDDGIPDQWIQAKDSNTTATFALSNVAKFGKKSISISNVTGTNGWAIVGSEKINYVAGEKYIVSGYVKTENISNTAIIKLEFFDDLGNSKGQRTEYELRGTHDWTRIQTVVDNVPQGTTRIRVTVGLNVGSGTAYFDGIQLEKGTVLGSYNLVENASFEKFQQDSKIPDQWIVSNNLSMNDGVEQKIVDQDNTYVGDYSFKLTGEKGKNKYIKQRIQVSGDANSRFTLSGWSKQVGADPNGGNYVMQLAINYTDGTVDWNYANDFDKTAEGWQHVAVEVKPSKAFDSIDVYYYYYDQLGTAWFDAMRLEDHASITSNSYDAGGNYLTGVIDPLGNSTSLGYDQVGNRTSITDGKGFKTIYGYDANNRLAKITDANQGVTFYGYDGVGNRTTVTNAKGNTIQYDYTEMNQVSKITDPLGKVIQFGYDRNGNQAQILFPKGDSITYSYNALNRMDGIYYNGNKKWGFSYDANGNVTSIADKTGKSTTLSYDKNNRITEQVEGSNKLGYGYDDNSNLKTLQMTAGTTTSTIGYGYNNLDQMVDLTLNGANQAKFIYDERGNITSVKRNNGTYTSFEYDDANRLKTLKNYDSSGFLLDSYGYTYDANSNITSIATKKGTISYQYDSLNQLVKETLLDGTTISYEYDSVGNRTKKVETKGTTATTTTYSYDAANQLTGVNGQAYSYDANGNLVNNGAKSFIYDEENRLIEVKDKQGTSLAKFTYDHEGKRTSMTTASGTIDLHYNGDKVIYETDENNNVVGQYTWDNQGNPVSMIKGGKTYYYQLNGHGDVIALTDAAGKVAAEYLYDAYGNIISQTGTIASENPYRYAGYRYDEGTGLYYLMARYYDAKDGRFITRDTFHGFEDDPQSLNQYAYVSNNPIMYIDPSGHWRIYVRVAGAIFNTLIGGITGLGANAIKGFIIRKGKEAAKQIFYKTIVSRLQAWGARKLAWTVGTAVGFAMNYFDVGGQIAKYIASHDRKPYSRDWIDF